MSLVESFDPLTSTNARLMCVWLRSRSDLVYRFFADPTWASRVDQAEVHDAFLEAIADVGIVLARLTELVESPPALERVRAEIELDLVQPSRVDVRLAALGRELDELHELIRFPAPRSALTELEPPASTPPQVGGEGATT